MMTRRKFLLSTALGGLAVAGFGFLRPDGNMTAEAAEGNFEVSFSEAEWRKKLTPDQFAVLRQAATERPFTSPLNDEHRAGTFACAGCDLPVFSSETKFDSGTGWPSFYAPIKGNVETEADNSLFMQRTECHCRRCGGHLGHVFDDGPQPTGQRWCINGVALNFEPSGA